MPAPTLQSKFELVRLQHARSRTLTQRLPRWRVEPPWCRSALWQKMLLHSGMDCLGGPPTAGQAEMQPQRVWRTSRASSLPSLPNKQRYSSALLRPTPPNTNGKLAPLLMSSFCCRARACTNKPRCHHHVPEHTLPLTGAPPHALADAQCKRINHEDCNSRPRGSAPTTSAVQQPSCPDALG